MPEIGPTALKRAITAMDIYDHPQEIRLNERRLSEGLGLAAHVEQHGKFPRRKKRDDV